VTEDISLESSKRQDEKEIHRICILHCIIDLELFSKYQ
jgi:hypothetical protein